MKLPVLIGFLVNLYTFILWVELILLPFLLLIYGMKTFSENTGEYASEQKLMKSLIAIVEFTLLVFVLFKTYKSYQQVFLARTVLDLVLPVLLLLLFLPFNYFSALYITYETMFTRIRFLFNDEQRQNCIKEHIQSVGGFDIDMLTAISTNLSNGAFWNAGDVRAYILTILKSAR